MIGRVMNRPFTYLSALLASLLLIASGPAAGGNFAIAPSEAERRLGQDSFEILETKRTASGVAGAQKWKLQYRDGLVLKAKWKAAPDYSADGWNNSPRREIAPYEIQKWFLDEKDYVVPTSEVRCIPLAVYREKVDPAAKPTLRGTNCVFGVLSLWLQDVEEPAEIWHPELFEQGGYYRESIAAVDVLTLLIGHQDGRPANFLWSTDGRHHVFSIDNGISFHAFPFNPLVKNWNNIRVPALSKKVVERLDRVGPEQIAALAVLRHLEPDADGILKVKPAPENLGPDQGNRVTRSALQLGLSQSELREIEERIGRLLHRVETGEIPLF
jgi:hypothetical protein